MIYCIPPDNYPTEGQFLEELSYKDENDFEWRIARIRNGFIVKYFGNDYFKEDVFTGELSDGSWFKIRNTNCIFFKDTDFDTFYEVRDVIKSGYTDDIWDVLNDCFTERFEHSKEILEAEMI